MTIKQFILLIAVLMAATALLVYFFLFKEKSTQNNPVDVPAVVDFRSSNNASQTPDSPTPNTSALRPTDPEEELSYDITTNIENWQTTKNPDSLRQALLLTHGTSNESFLGAWKSLLETSPSDITDVLADGTNENDQVLLQSADLIFSWFIDISGNFSSLSPMMQQEVQKGYEQIKIYTNARS